MVSNFYRIPFNTLIIIVSFPISFRVNRNATFYLPSLLLLVPAGVLLSARLWLSPDDALPSLQAPLLAGPATLEVLSTEPVHATLNEEREDLQREEVA